MMEQHEGRPLGKIRLGLAQDQTRLEFVQNGRLRQAEEHGTMITAVEGRMLRPLGSIRNT